MKVSFYLSFFSLSLIWSFDRCIFKLCVSADVAKTNEKKHVWNKLAAPSDMLSDLKSTIYSDIGPEFQERTLPPIKRLWKPGDITPIYQSSDTVLKFQLIVDWKILFEQFKNTMQTAFFPGVIVHGIPCPKFPGCPAIDVSFQPPSFFKHMGICGVDIRATELGNGRKTDIFVLPTLMAGGKRTADAIEGARGLIATSSGILFNLAGGCEACISSEPEVGETVKVDRIIRIKDNAIVGLHSHSWDYYSSLHELIPRIQLVMPYVKSSFNMSSEHTIIVTRTPTNLVNDANKLLEWGFEKTLAQDGSVVHQMHGIFIKVTSNVIVPITRNWLSQIRSSIGCLVNQLVEAYPKKGEFKCMVELPSKYLMVLPHELERGHKLFQHLALVEMLENMFDVPIIVPHLHKGCSLSDTIRYYHGAIGFIAPFGTSFSNIIFMPPGAIIIQLVPMKPHDFAGLTENFHLIATNFGLRAYQVSLDDSGRPRFDLNFIEARFLRILCNEPKTNFRTGTVNISPEFAIWFPSKKADDRCRKHIEDYRRNSTYAMFVDKT